MRSRVSIRMTKSILTLWFALSFACGGPDDTATSEDAASATFKLKSARSGKCLSGASGQVSQSSCRSNPALFGDLGRIRLAGNGNCFFGTFFLGCNEGLTPFQWTFHNIGDGGGKLLEHGSTGRCLAEVDGRTAAFASCDRNDPAQRWRKIAP